MNWEERLPRTEFLMGLLMLRLAISLPPSPHFLQLLHGNRARRRIPSCFILFPGIPWRFLPGCTVMHYIVPSPRLWRRPSCCHSFGYVVLVSSALSALCC